MTRVCIDEPRHNLKIRSIFEAFFTDLILTDVDPHFIVNINRVKMKDVEIVFTEGQELKELYFFLETITPSMTEWGTLMGVRPLKHVHKKMDAGFHEKEIQNYLHQELLISERKSDLLIEIANVQRHIYLKDRDKLSVYLSIPFCPSICTYCNFHTRVYQSKLVNRYMEELYHDMKLARELADAFQRKIDLLYIGGGTPTSLSDDEFSLLFSKVEELYPIESLLEFTVESGRIDTFTRKKRELMTKAHRVCVNPQSLTPSVLKGVNRELLGDLKADIDFFEEHGVIVNSDIICGLPGETPDTFQQTIKGMIELAPRNITIHDLSKKKGSELVDKTWKESDVTSMLKDAYDMLKGADYSPYYIYRQKNILANGENIGYAKGDTACIYNIRMMEDAHEILALGSSATSKFLVGERLYRIQNVKELTLWMENRERRRHDLENFFMKNVEGSN